MIRQYLRLILFSACLLMGIQIPALMDQYQKRVDAHLQEAQLALSGFQLTADRYFNGSLAQLIKHYRSSSDEVFRADADNIASLYSRYQSLAGQWQALQQGELMRAYFVLQQSTSSIMSETLAQYSYTVPLSPRALLWGCVVALLFCSVLEFTVLMLLRALIQLRPFPMLRGKTKV